MKPFHSYFASPGWECAFLQERRKKEEEDRLKRCSLSTFEQSRVQNRSSVRLI